MYSKAIDWVKRIDLFERAEVDNNQKIIKPISAIQPEFLFTHNTIGFYLDSATAKDYWYRAGSIHQLFLVPFGNTGYAEGEKFFLTLKRYQIYRFNQFPNMGNTEYRISFVPEFYFQDIHLQVWEYGGVNQGSTLDSLAVSLNKQLANLAKLQTLVNKLLKK